MSELLHDAKTFLKDTKAKSLTAIGEQFPIRTRRFDDFLEKSRARRAGIIKIFPEVGLYVPAYPTSEGPAVGGGYDTKNIFRALSNHIRPVEHHEHYYFESDVTPEEEATIPINILFYRLLLTLEERILVIQRELPDAQIQVVNPPGINNDFDRRWKVLAAKQKKMLPFQTDNR